MTNIPSLSVLIVDRSNDTAFDLRRAFVNAGVNTHVVGGFASAQTMIDNKHIDAVLVEFSLDADTVAFCNALSLRSIPRFFTCKPPTRPDVVEGIAPLHSTAGACEKLQHSC